MSEDWLLLDNQLCFPFYAAHRLITRAYQPLLDELDLTYPQYLVLLVLWERDNVVVSEIASRLILNTNTLTPVLKRLQAQGLIERRRDTSDERKVHVRLTTAGSDLRARALKVPQALVQALDYPDAELIDLKTRIDAFLRSLTGGSRSTASDPPQDSFSGSS